MGVASSAQFPAIQCKGLSRPAHQGSNSMESPQTAEAVTPVQSPTAHVYLIFCLYWITDILAQEVVRGMRESASRGFWVSSYAPFGYNRVMVQDGAKKRPSLQPNPDASHIVKRIFDMAEAGNGMTDITRTLNNEGIASPRGKLWGKTSVHAVLINEAYTGTLVRGFQLRLNHQ